MKSLHGIACLIALCFCMNANFAFSQEGNCKMGNLPVIQFSPGSIKLSKAAISLLQTVAIEVKNNPGCNLKVIGYGTANKSSQQFGWDRVNAVINYLVEQQGISYERFIFTYGECCDPDTFVNLEPTTESGQVRPAPPHPHTRKN